MLEKEIEQTVCKYAREKFDAKTYKFSSPSRMNVPDRLFIFPNGQVLFIEFKAPGKKPTEGQQREIERLVKCRQNVVVIDDVTKGVNLVYAVGKQGGFWG